ncbi:MAG: hypothetical protein JSW67_13595, partial [Candidatus Latescibacterota bacterium]
MTGRKILIGVVALGVVAFVYYQIAGWPPIGDGGQATIGQVKRDVTPQIGEGDVVVEDAEFLAFMQTDFFHDLVTDKEFQEKVASGELALGVLEAQGMTAMADVLLRNQSFRRGILDSDIDLAASVVDKTAVMAREQAFAKEFVNEISKSSEFEKAVRANDATLAAEALGKETQHMVANASLLSTSLAGL